MTKCKRCRTGTMKPRPNGRIATCDNCGNEERIIVEPNPSSEFVSVEDIIK